MRKIFDVHCHIYPEKIAAKASNAIGEFYSIPMKLDGSVKKLLEQMELSGTTKAAVHSVATIPHQVHSINKFIAEVQKSMPDKFIGFGTLHPESETIEADVEEIIDLGLNGIKIHPDFQKFNLDSKSAEGMFKIVGDRLPFLVHMGDKRFTYSSPERLKNLMKSVPGIKVIGAHFGGYSMWEHSSKILSDIEGLYVDCSSSLFALPKEKAIEIIKRYTSQRVFYGSDYPMWDLKEEIERFDSLGLSEKDSSDILWNNAERFFKL